LVDIRFFKPQHRRFFGVVFFGTVFYANLTYICNIIGRTPDDAQVVGEIHLGENDEVLMKESKVGNC